mmetsp:Transcript_18994/g.41388  ORF Transcript_18994/g.41388 Transcript_18994/m.41388 type:complete len:135 (-) Transcript_18994:1436-1840(-)
MEPSSLLLYSGIAFIVLAYPAVLLIGYLSKGKQPKGPSAKTNYCADDTTENNNDNNKNNIIIKNNPNNPPTNSAEGDSTTQREKPKYPRINDGGGWKCACEEGGIFLPQSLMKSIGGPSAAFKLGAGSCYHKQV